MQDFLSGPWDPLGDPIAQRFLLSRQPNGQYSPKVDHKLSENADNLKITHSQLRELDFSGPMRPEVPHMLACMVEWSYRILGLNVDSFSFFIGDNGMCIDHAEFPAQCSSSASPLPGCGALQSNVLAAGRLLYRRARTFQAL